MQGEVWKSEEVRLDEVPGVSLWRFERKAEV